MGGQPAGGDGSEDRSVRQPGVGGRGDSAVGEPVGAPRWVKMFAVIGVVVVVLILVMLLTGHGPGRHMQHGLGALSGMSLGTAGLARW